MRVFDRIDPQAIDRRELQLWLLACAMIIVLAAGTALLMYPAVLGQQVVISGQHLKAIFFGFCALAALLAVYLLDRHLTVRYLRRQLMEEQRRNIDLRLQAGVDLLDSLPALGHFQDRLAMEFRRASTIHQPLSLLVIKLKPLRTLTGANEITIALGDATKALMRKLRVDDSLYLFGPGSLGIMLPGIDGNNAYRVADRLAEGLRDASGACNRFSFDVYVFNYPEHASTSQEMERAVRSLLPEDLPEQCPLEASRSFDGVLEMDTEPVCRGHAEV